MAGSSDEQAQPAVTSQQAQPAASNENVQPAASHDSTQLVADANWMKTESIRASRGSEEGVRIETRDTIRLVPPRDEDRGRGE